MGFIILLMFLLLIFLFIKFNQRKRKNDIGKIYRTYDGFFQGKKHITKERNVVVVDQRDDGALAVSKIVSKKGKSDNTRVKNLTLKPKKHPSLTEDSLVELKVEHGHKNEKGGVPLPIMSEDLNKDENGKKLTIPEDSVTKKELKKIRSQQKKNDKRHHKTTNKRWHNHFK